MEITLRDNEINEAIKQYVNTLGFNTENKSVEVSVKLGRSGNGNSAQVEILPLGSKPTVSTDAASVSSAETVTQADGSSTEEIF